MVLQLGLWYWAANHERSFLASVSIALLAGAAGGVAVLTRPSWLLFTPLFAALWIIGSRFERRQLFLCAAMLAGLALAMLPWWVRNYQVVGRFVATSLWVGPSLYDGLSSTAYGSSNMSFVSAFEVKLRAADAADPPAATAPPFEYRFDRMMWNDAMQWAAENPVRALRLAVTKLVRMWNIWPNEPQFRSWLTRLVIAGTYTPILLLAVYGAWRFRDRRLEVLMLIFPAIYFSLIHAIFIGSLRYRQPAMLTLAILAAATLDHLWARYTERTTQLASSASSHEGFPSFLPASSTAVGRSSSGVLASRWWLRLRAADISIYGSTTKSAGMSNSCLPSITRI
jgi:hypothetical protein